MVSISRPVAVAVSNSSVMLRTRTPYFSSSATDIQDQARLAAEAIQLENQELIELPLPGSFKHALACGTGFNRHRPGDTVVGEDLEDGQPMEFAVPLAELALRKDGLPLALFFCADSKVKGNAHGFDHSGGDFLEPAVQRRHSSLKGLRNASR